MAELEKLMGVSASDIEKVMGVAKADIEKVMGVDVVSMTSYQGNRGIGMGGQQVNTGGELDVIEYKAMTSDNDTLDFGNLSADRSQAGTVGNDTRAVAMSGYDGSAETNIIEYVTIASTGNTTDFGNMVIARRYGGGSGSGIRGVYHSGNMTGTHLDNIDYITVASAGDATDFGDCTRGTSSSRTGNAHTTRGIWWMSWDGDYTNLDANYITFASTGNAGDFGDWSAAVADNAAIGLIESKNIWGGGRTSGAAGTWATMEYVTPMSTGNTTSQGDLGSATYDPAGKFTNGTRGELWGGGALAHSEVQKVTIASTGNAAHAGDVREHGSSSGYNARSAWDGWTGD